LRNKKRSKSTFAAKRKRESMRCEENKEGDKNNLEELQVSEEEK
jgi:hypothetical protein